MSLGYTLLYVCIALIKQRLYGELNAEDEEFFFIELGGDLTVSR